MLHISVGCRVLNVNVATIVLYLIDTVAMGVLHEYLLCAFMVVLVHGYDLRTNRKFNLLERKVETIYMELQDVKKDLRVETEKSINLEIQLNELMNGTKVTTFDDNDSDLTEHHSVVHNQQDVGSQAMSVEQRIYDAMKDEKNVRKQFEKQMKTDFMIANKHTEMKFTTLKETLSAVIDNKLDTIEDKVHASLAGLNEASSSMTNLTIQVQQNDEAITSLMLESDQLNTTLLRYGTKMETIEVDLASNVQKNNEYISNLRIASDQLNTTLLRYGTKLETIEVDLANKVEELIDNSHRYKVRCFNGAKHSEDGTCECTMPYYGTHCEKGCFNDGKYLKDGSCEFSRLYVGAKCEKVRCFNDAKHSEDGTCECTMPYYGTHCEKGCFNDGKYLEDGSCECSRLYVGAKCEKVHCLNGANYSEEGTCECTMQYYGTHCEKVYTDCYDIHQYTDKPTGIYTVVPRGSYKTIDVKCDMDTNGGGWTVFQYRHDGSVDFYKKFDEYENGFGSLTGEFWLGLQYIHVMTSYVPSVLRIDVEAADGTQAYQTYDDFNTSEGPDYRLNIGATSGTAGDNGYYGLLNHNKGQPFSTYDRDRDGSSANCAERYHGAWWYGWCGVFVNLNAEYATPGTTSTIYHGWGGMIYSQFKNRESLKSSKLMFKRK